MTEYPIRPLARPRSGADRATESDEHLLEQVRAGDHDAYAELYRRYEPDARRMARSLVQSHDVEDVVAESFTKMLQALQRDSGPVNHPVRYLMVAVRSAAYTLHRRRGSRRVVTERLKTETRTDDAMPQLQDDALIRAFRSLSPKWRQVVWWHEIEGLTPAEIGERLGLTANAASAVGYRARRALRQAYLDETGAASD